MTPDTQAMALAKVDEAVKYVERRRSESFQRLNSTSSGDWEFHLKPLRALRKAIERHGPDERYSNDPPLCKSCWEEGEGDYDICGHGQEMYPCKFITEIAKEMGI